MSVNGTGPLCLTLSMVPTCRYAALEALKIAPWSLKNVSCHLLLVNWLIAVVPSATAVVGAQGEIRRWIANLALGVLT